MAGRSHLTSNYQTVAEYYAGKSLFITGGTGFLGKVLIEKLLFTCEDIDKIYLLVRDKKNTIASDRIDEMLINPLFTRLKKTRPECIKKLIPIIGDISETNLGISSAAEELLTEKVSLVFHLAATVKFDDPLSEALKINVEGTRNLLDFCHKMKKLEMFVYCSTLYSQCDKEIIDEVMYPPPIGLDELYLKLNDNEIKVTEYALSKRPNIYTFTKSLTESLVQEKHGKIPTVIIRPSIVGPVNVGPEPGWLDNWYGATWLLFCIGLGQLRVLRGKKEGIIDVIPVDYVSNLTIVAAAKSDRSKGLCVYNSGTSESNPITLYNLTHKLLNQEPKKNNILPNVLFTPSKSVLILLSFLLERIPAIIGDFWFWLTGKRTKLVKLLGITTKTRNYLDFFTTHYWQAQSHKAKSLINTLSFSDQQVFRCDTTDIDWDVYMPLYYNGIRKYLQKRTVRS